jgi:hypothetical protein
MWNFPMMWNFLMVFMISVVPMLRPMTALVRPLAEV